MAMTPVPPTGVSVELVAYMLMERIATCEGKALHTNGSLVDRGWILATYAECLATVRNPDVKWPPA